MWEDTDQNNLKQEQFLSSDDLLGILKFSDP